VSRLHRRNFRAVKAGAWTKFLETDTSLRSHCPFLSALITRVSRMHAHVNERPTRWTERTHIWPTSGRTANLDPLCTDVHSEKFARRLTMRAKREIKYAKYATFREHQSCLTFNNEMISRACERQVKYASSLSRVYIIRGNNQVK